MKKVYIEQPLPRTRHGILSFIDRAAFQKNVLEVALRPDGIYVTREVANEDEEVVPAGSNDIDIPFLLAHIEMITVPFDPAAHAFYVLHQAVETVYSKGREPFALLVPGYAIFDAWLGIPSTKSKNRKFFGLSVISVPPLVTNNRVVVLGAPSNSIFLTHSDVGVAVDLGV